MEWIRSLKTKFGAREETEFGAREQKILKVKIGEDDEIEIDCLCPSLCLSASHVGKQLTFHHLKEVFFAHTDVVIVRELSLEGHASLTSVPILIGSFGNLETLSLKDNNLTDLPWTITYGLRRLKKLDISNNALTKFPDKIGRLSHLEVLNARNNQIITVPEHVLYLTKLKILDVSENPLQSPPVEVANKGIKEVFEYLRKQQERVDLWDDEGRENIAPRQGRWDVFDGYNVDRDIHVLSLQNISVRCIMKHKMDFLDAKFLPTRLKSILTEYKEEIDNSICVCKCSYCKKYFSTKAYFEAHHCDNYRSTNFFPRRVMNP